MNALKWSKCSNAAAGDPIRQLELTLNGETHVTAKLFDVGEGWYELQTIDFLGLHLKAIRDDVSVLTRMGIDETFHSMELEQIEQLLNVKKIEQLEHEPEHQIILDHWADVFFFIETYGSNHSFYYRLWGDNHHIRLYWMPKGGDWTVIVS